MNTTTNTPPVGWQVIEDGIGSDYGHEDMHIGPEFLGPETEYGVKLLWTPEGINFGVSSDSDMDVLSRSELLGLRNAINKALQVADEIG